MDDLLKISVVEKREDDEVGDSKKRRRRFQMKHTDKKLVGRTFAGIQN